MSSIWSQSDHILLRSVGIKAEDPDPIHTLIALQRANEKQMKQAMWMLEGTLIGIIFVITGMLIIAWNMGLI